jgi:ABC-type transport system involved in cytochrome c biogenesis permease subunit
MSFFVRLQRLGRRCANPELMFWALIWLMVLLVAGTVAQKYIGLYQAQKLFFYAWVLWIGPIPVPAGMATIGLIFLTLTAKLLFASVWTLQKSGTIITHIGAMLLLGGGLVTYLDAREASLVVHVGETVNYTSSYHDRELVVLDMVTSKKIDAVPFDNMRVGQVFTPQSLPFKLEILSLCRNCVPVKRDNVTDDLRGRAREIDLQSIPLDMNDEVNQAGLQYRLIGAGVAQDGIYLSVDFIDVGQKIELAGRTFLISLRKVREQLPFAIELKKFDHQVHPGTDIPRLYRSDVMVHDAGGSWPAVIQMNEPLRFRGYTLFQASFVPATENAPPATVLAVVKNNGRLFPYIASIVMCFGILLHLILKLPKLIVRVVVFTAIIFMPHIAQAAELNLDTFRHLPVMEDGRIKPFDTFAETKLEIIYGRASLPDMSAAAWLAEVLFDQEQAYNRPIFRINDPRIASALELPPINPRLYAFKDISIALTQRLADLDHMMQLPEDQLDPMQRQMLELYARVRMYGELSRSMTLLLPDFYIQDEKIAALLNVPVGTRLKYLQITAARPKIEQYGIGLMQARLKRKDTQSGISDQGRAILELLQHLDQIDGDADSAILRIIPPSWSNDKARAPWLSPWRIGVEGQGSPATATILTAWAMAAQAYRNLDAIAWNRAITRVQDTTLQLAGPAVMPWHLNLEVIKNSLSPLTISLYTFGFSFVLMLLSFLNVRPEWLQRTAMWLLGAGLVMNAVGIIMRMMIMGRPPVTNLYESIIFVSFITVGLALIYAWRTRESTGVLVGAVAGIVLQFMGQRFNLDGDTMGMLTAVLDTNFWLATHVVAITIGYGICVMGGMLAHIALLDRLIKPYETGRHLAIARQIRGISYLALFFTALGTILGGIWADQSWGRFWGWDPKENGALLIVLWLLMITHGRLAGRIGDLGFAACMVVTNVIVALAWFGVNLLGVGLHSYGFTEGAIQGLVIFCTGEIVFAAALYAVIRSRDGRTTIS